MFSCRLRGPVVGRSRRAVILSYVVVLGGLGVVAGLGGDLARLRSATVPYRGPAVVRPPGGTLVLCGGGRMTDEVRGYFLELAGGRRAKIVVIPTASPAADGAGVARALDVWKALGPASVNVLHTHSR